jgi:hypothetical protein
MAQIKGDKDIHVTEEADSTKVETEGGLQIEFEDIQKVSIFNITRVSAYALSQPGDFIIHEISFTNGGFAKLAYSTSGKIMEFRTRGIVVRAEGDRITLDVHD